MFIHSNYLPNDWKIQTWNKDPVSQDQIKDKVPVPRERNYIVSGLVLNKTGLFAVTKGDDTHIFYKAENCSLKADLWCTIFYLTDIDSILHNAY